jgi:hypothetical protein
MKDPNDLSRDRPVAKHRWQMLRSRLTLWWDVLKYPLLFVITFVLVTRFGRGAWVEWFKAGVSILLSIAMIGYIAYEIWRNKHRLHLVRQVYLRSGILTYVRALLIFVATTTTTLIAWEIMPNFMRYGWTNFVFGYSTNIAFQPVATIDQVNQAQSRSGFPLDIGAILAIGFWLLMILALPFLAEIEERVFRQGIHTWKGISRSSLLFGLIHLIMGIPLFMGFVLFVPGFLFACRYKYAYHQHLKQFATEERVAQEVGVQASTADHAVYNALLVTVLTAALLFLR